MSTATFEIRSCGIGSRTGYLENKFNEFLTMQEPFVEVEPIGYSSSNPVRSCSWSIKQALINYGYDYRITEIIRNGKLYLVRNEFLDDFKHAFAIKRLKEITKIPTASPCVHTCECEENTDKKTFKETIEMLSNLWATAFTLNLVKPKSLKGPFAEIVEASLKDYSKFDLINFGDYAVSVFNGNMTNIDSDLGYVLIHIIDTKLKFM